jgi:rod shape-determining protein MreC
LDYILVDKGKKDGVKEKAAVIATGALVGQVSEVYDDYSKIVLITSKDSNILAMLQESRAQGILKGGISGLVLEDITQDAEIKNGEYVIASGLDGEIPQGTLIGKAGRLKSSSSDLFKNISIEPIVDLSKLEIAFIIK